MIKPIPKEKLEFLRKLRNNPTPWESKLWDHLKDKNLGFRFKRQVYIGGYLVDVCCYERKLVIEIDGGYHRSRKIQDKQRSEFLQREGYKILRIWNYEIDKDINKVLNKIIKSLN